MTSGRWLDCNSLTYCLAPQTVCNNVWTSYLYKLVSLSSLLLLFLYNLNVSDWLKLKRQKGLCTFSINRPYLKQIVQNLGIPPISEVKNVLRRMFYSFLFTGQPTLFFPFFSLIRTFFYHSGGTFLFSADLRLSVLLRVFLDLSLLSWTNAVSVVFAVLSRKEGVFFSKKKHNRSFSIDKNHNLASYLAPRLGDFSFPQAPGPS